MSRWGVLVLSGALAAASSVVADPLLAANPDVSSHVAGYSSRAGHDARIVFVSGVVDAFEVHGERGGFVGGEKRAD